MIKTIIDMSKVKDKRNPFNNAIWREATLEEENTVFKALSRLNNFRK